MCDPLWEFLASRYAVHRDGRSTWTVEKPTGFQPVTHSGAFRTVGGDLAPHLAGDRAGPPTTGSNRKFTFLSFISPYDDSRRTMGICAWSGTGEER
jgi:hypothetical protein